MSDLVLDLRRTLDQPALAREFVAGHLADYPADVRADAQLLVSELVSNVVQHGAVPARMLLRMTGPLLRVIVEDSGPDLPDTAAHPDPSACSGRGLIIVASIAAAWGISTVSGQVGKGVWFDLPLTP